MKIKRKWAKDHKDASKISSGQAGTGAGFQNLLLAKLISQTLQDLLKTKKEKLEDKGIKYHEFKIAQDGVTIAVNKDNDFVKN